MSTKKYSIPILLSASFLLAGPGCTTTKTTTTSGEYSFDFGGGPDKTILDAKLKQLVVLSEKYPKRSDLPYQIAGVYYQKQEYHEAVNAIHHAIEIDPGEAKYHYHLGRLYLKMRELEQAEQAFRKALQLMPPNRYTGGHGALGYVLCQRGKWAEALEQYKACVRIDPTDPNCYYYLGCVHDVLGQSKEAISHLRTYLGMGGTMFRNKAIQILLTHGVKLSEEELELKGPNPL